MTKNSHDGQADPTAQTFADYLRAAVGDMTQSSISARTGIDQPRISRWLRAESRPTFDAVVSVARGLALNTGEALIAAGYLRRDDLTLPSADPRGLSTVVLLAELARRTGTEAIA